MQQYRIKFILGKITAYVDALRLGKTTVEDLTGYTQTAVEIEHIMPQTCTDKASYDLDEEEFAVYIHRLGNLTLLENSINKSIHNDNYANKSVAYKQSKFYITSSLFFCQIIDVTLVDDTIVARIANTKISSK